MPSFNDLLDLAEELDAKKPNRPPGFGRGFEPPGGGGGGGRPSAPWQRPDEWYSIGRRSNDPAKSAEDDFIMYLLNHLRLPPDLQRLQRPDYFPDWMN